MGKFFETGKQILERINMNILYKLSKKIRTSEVTPDTIRFAYKLILNREPESIQAINNHLNAKSLQELGQIMMSSEEFRSNNKTFENIVKSQWIAVEVMDDFVQWVNLTDNYVSRGCMSDNYEPNETAFLKSRVKEGDVILDIGANIGWFTLLACKMAGPKGKVHSFEPRPDTSRMLQRTISMNKLEDRVTLWQAALSDETGELHLNWGKNTDNPGGSFVSRDNLDSSGYEQATVMARRLDDLLPEADPDFIKIDVEGAEPMVINGALNAIRRKKPAILSELHPQQLNRVSGKTPADYITQMEAEGYSCYLLENGVPTKNLKNFPNELGKDLVSVVFETKG
jgi:FkbM family methyltransferase